MQDNVFQVFVLKYIIFFTLIKERRSYLIDLSVVFVFVSTLHLLNLQLKCNRFWVYLWLNYYYELQAPHLGAWFNMWVGTQPSQLNILTFLLFKWRSISFKYLKVQLVSTNIDQIFDNNTVQNIIIEMVCK